MIRNYTKKDAIRIVANAARDYKKLLDGKNYLFIYRDKATNEIDYFETIFLPRNFQHLTGLEFLDSNGTLKKNAIRFYQKCLDGTLSTEEIRFKTDGTTELKLEILPRLIQYLHTSKMTGLYNKSHPLLQIDRVAGTVSYCIGFRKEDGYFIPVSCLMEDVRNLGNNLSQIITVMEKEASGHASVYRNIRYVAKGVPLDKIQLPDKLKDKILFENYITKKK